MRTELTSSQLERSRLFAIKFSIADAESSKDCFVDTPPYFLALDAPTLGAEELTANGVASGAATARMHQHDQCLLACP